MAHYGSPSVRVQIPAAPVGATAPVARMAALLATLQQAGSVDPLAHLERVPAVRKKRRQGVPRSRKSKASATSGSTVNTIRRLKTSRPASAALAHSMDGMFTRRSATASSHRAGTAGTAGAGGVRLGGRRGMKRAKSFSMARGSRRGTNSSTPLHAQDFRGQPRASSTYAHWESQDSSVLSPPPARPSPTRRRASSPTQR